MNEQAANKLCHTRERRSSACVAQQENTPARCSKRPDVSPPNPGRYFTHPPLSLPRQPLHPGTRLVPGKAEANYHSYGVGGFFPTARVQGGPSEAARCASTGIVPPTPPIFSILLTQRGMNPDAHVMRNRNHTDANDQMLRDNCPRGSMLCLGEDVAEQGEQRKAPHHAHHYGLL